MDKKLEQIGKVTIEDQVIADYVQEIILNNKDVSRFHTSLTEGLTKNILGIESATSSGIRIQNDDYNLTINLHIIVYYGVNIPQLSYDLQTTIKRSVEKFTGLNVDAVNITVEGIDRREH